MEAAASSETLVYIKLHGVEPWETVSVMCIALITFSLHVSGILNNCRHLNCYFSTLLQCISFSAMNPMSMQNLVTLAAMTGGNGANLQVSPTGKYITDFFVKFQMSVYTHHNQMTLRRSLSVISMYWEIILLQSSICMAFFYSLFNL
jgi:hypothetical protein